MAVIQEVSSAAWRRQLIPASFGGAQYHVEQQARSSGQRVVVHTYPKRDTPYAEPMGRQPLRYQVTGYLIGPNYHLAKRALMAQLDGDGATLVDPYLAEPKKCVCERYNVTENRERGGFCTFEMMFVECGTPGNQLLQQDTAGNVERKADTTANAAADRVNSVARGNPMV